ncbi:ABC transporter ATP-binding protein/permease [Bacillus sp. A17A.1]
MSHGLYPIDTGEVLYEGIPLQLIDQEQLYKSITVLFQDYMRYNLSVKENIALSDINNKEELNRLFDAMKKADVYDFVNSFKEGIDTVLGRVLIEGEDLSGGQWQKIAIARALYKGGELFILDEPTSALDPKAEIDVYQNFDKLVQHKTAIFISHRMASARMADKIIVMKDGNIIEFGSHSELMSLDSEYSRMYNMQSEWYYDSEVVQSV